MILGFIHRLYVLVFLLKLDSLNKCNSQIETNEKYFETIVEFHNMVPLKSFIIEMALLNKQIMVFKQKTVTMAIS